MSDFETRPETHAEKPVYDDYELVCVELMGTYDIEDKVRMAETGMLVIPVAFGQAVYRLKQET